MKNQPAASRSRTAVKGGLHTRLIASHLCVGIIPLLFIGVMLWLIASQGLKTVGGQGVAAVEQAAYDELKVMCQIKEKQIASFFKKMEGQMYMLRDNPWLMQVSQEFGQVFAGAGNSVSSDAWQKIAKENDFLFQDVCRDFDWHNVFLINAQGSIIYSLNKASDLGLSLSRPPLMSSSLGRAFAQLQQNSGQEMAFGDYAPYAPLNNEPSAFLITRIKNKGEGNIFLAVQPSTEALRNMIRLVSEHKKTLEAYLVGKDGYMRSDSLVAPERYSRVESFRQGNKVNTEASRNALKGESGTGVITDYLGNTVLSSWSSVDVFGVRWALICEVNESEALRYKTVMNKTSAEASRQVVNSIIAALLLTFLAVGAVAWFIARSISKPIIYAAGVADIIAAGDLTQRLHLRRSDEIGQLADALDFMVDTVAKNFRHKAGIAELSEQTRGQQDARMLAQTITSFLVRYLGAQMASLYLADKSGKALLMTGSYAFSKRKGLNSMIELGEGLAGQAALEKSLISVTDLPEGYVRISSTLGDAAPCNIVAAPFLHEDRLVGVIELASFKEFSDADMNFLRDVTSSIAIVFDVARRRQEVQELLEETQRQSEELRHQSEELKTTNEELEAQTVALKEFQEELESQQAELEATNSRLKEKTEALISQKNEIETRNQELIAAREEIEERSRDLALASKYKSEFLANMSHELRTPLNSLLLLSQTLSDNKQGNLTEHQQEAAGVIVESGKDLLNLINEILDLSKIEAGRVEVEAEEVPLTEVAENARNLFRHMAELKGLEFSVSIDPALPENIFTDRKRIEQIVKNFIGNSIKFTETGSVRLAFTQPPKNTRLRREGLLADESIAISVTDTGIGIPQDKQKIIFEAFQQADGSTGRKYGGTGLGLSISRELAALLGGEIQLVSEPGKGSVFTLYLPLSCPETPDEKERTPTAPPRPAAFSLSPRQQPPQEIPTDDRNRLTPETRSILIIEDDRKFAKILMDQCRQRSFKVLAAETGEEGLQLAERHQPTGIILDIKLPGIDGWTVLTSLKTNPSTRHIPVHMMSVEEGSREAFRQGAVGFFTKPVDQEQIAEALARFESISSSKVKRLLVVEDDNVLRAALVELVGSEDTVIEEAKTGAEANELLHSQQFDCMVLDLGLPDCNGIELLRTLVAEQGLRVPPVIIYTGRELSRDEEKELNKYAESIIIKNARSRERLLDETSLFLHRVVEQMPDKKQEIITGLYDQENIFKGKRILLVDDDMRNVFALSGILEDKGMEVIIAEDGKKALKALAEDGQIDLVLMDIMMPEMDGYEATRKIRAQREFRDLPVIALTAKAMKEDREKCIEAGASDYLAKPIDLERLLSMMRVWLYR
ncbi:MAG: signal transduction histidine kinase [Candidatus Electronema aureum]|uniref:histidine kinase n=1 Tax=Candidatus Electronema aureum TaxID=2005002 RepID=A0A521G1Z5_9BACT|nr:MAG: signal transduction histidine kinase [Candidatus Electronema aureum]